MAYNLSQSRRVRSAGKAARIISRFQTVRRGQGNQSAAAASAAAAIPEKEDRTGEEASLSRRSPVAAAVT